MTLKPMHDWAVIRPSDAQEMTESGLYIPDTAKDKPYEGIVVAIGPGAYEEEKYGKKKEEGKERKFIPTTIKPGDLVLYERYAGQTYTIDGEELILVRERNILGLLFGKPDRTSVKPLQIPAVTSSQATTMLAKRPAAPLMKMPEKTAKKAAAKPAVKKKAAKKAVKKTSSKKGQGAGGKGPGKPKTATKAIAKKTVAKKGKKTAKKK